MRSTKNLMGGFPRVQVAYLSGTGTTVVKFIDNQCEYLYASVFTIIFSRKTRAEYVV
jgi:hypothetical protein